MYLQNILSALQIGVVDRDLTVKTTGSEQRGVENVGAVGCRDDDNALVRAKAVHLYQQLVERLLALVVTAAQAGTSVTADRVDLIDKDDGRGSLACVLKQVAHTGCTDTDVHFHEIRARDREEGNTCFTGNCLCKQGLTRTGRAHEQNAMGDFCTKTGELAGSLEEFHDLLQLLLFLVRTCNVLETNLVLGIGNGGLDARFAKAIDLVALAACALHGNKVEYDKYNHDQNEGEELYPNGPNDHGIVDNLFNQTLLGKGDQNGPHIALEVFHIRDLVDIGLIFVGGIGQGVFAEADHAALDTHVGFAVTVSIRRAGKGRNDLLIVFYVGDLLLCAAAAEQHKHHNGDQRNEYYVKKDHL